MKMGLMGRLEVFYKRIPSALVEYIYLLAFSLVLIYDYNFLTRFDRAPFRLLYIAGAALACVVLVIKAMNVRNEARLAVVSAFLILLIGIGYFWFRRSYYFLVLAVLIVGATHLEAKKLFFLYSLIASLFFAVMFFHYIIHNPGWSTRAACHFGSINTTDCQAMILFIIVAFLFYRGERIRYIELLGMAAIVIWFWSHTHAEANMMCSLAGLLIAAIKKTCSILKIHFRVKTRMTI